MIIQPRTITVGQATIDLALATIATEIRKHAPSVNYAISKRKSSKFEPQMRRAERAYAELEAAASKSDLQLLSELHARTLDAAERRLAERADAGADALRFAASYLASARSALAVALEATAEIDDSAQDMPSA